MTRSKSDQNFFTLIELIVVIAILAIMASILQPALKNTILKSQQIQCSSNLKQIGSMSAMYIDDHSGLFTPDMLNWGPGYWIANLMTLYGDQKFIHRKFNPLGTIFACPTVESGKESEAPLYLQGGLGYNHMIGGSIANQERWIERNGGKELTNHISAVTHPAETALFGDDMDAGYQPPGYFHARLLNYNVSNRFQGKGINGALGARGRHQYAANYFFIDGHLENMTWQQFTTEGLSKGNYDWYLLMSKN